MTTTIRITDIAHLLDLTDYAGELLDDYDMDAVRRDFVAELQAAVFDGITITASGEVYAEARMAGVAWSLDWDCLAEGIDPAPIFERHNRRST